MIDIYNDHAPLSYKVNKDALPVPYLGNVFSSKIVLLQLNPGSDFPPGFSKPNESFEYKIFPRLKKDNKYNLRHQYNKIKYPFYALNPVYRLTGGFRYWSRIFGPLMKCADDYIEISKKICCIEFFPYHSKKFSSYKPMVKSQQYTFHLVRRAIDRNALIVLLRGEKEWRKEVKELTHFIRPKSTRNPVLSKNNFSKKDFAKIVSILFDDN